MRSDASRAHGRFQSTLPHGERRAKNFAGMVGRVFQSLNRDRGLSNRLWLYDQARAWAFQSLNRDRGLSNDTLAYSLMIPKEFQSLNRDRGLSNIIE